MYPPPEGNVYVIDTFLLYPDWAYTLMPISFQVDACLERARSLVAPGEGPVPVDMWPSSSSVWANRSEVYCDPASELSRIRLNSDYAEVGVKPGNGGLPCSGGAR